MQRREGKIIIHHFNLNHMRRAIKVLQFAFSDKLLIKRLMHLS